MKEILLIQGLWLQISPFLVEMTSETEERREKHIQLKLYSLQLTVKYALIMSSAITKISSRASQVSSASKNLGHSSTQSFQLSKQTSTTTSQATFHMGVIIWLACKAFQQKGYWFSHFIARHIVCQSFLYPFKKHSKSN